MNYAAFKDYLLRFLWRDGDTVLESDLDHLIKMGEARLNRDLRVDDMTTITTSTLTSAVLALPADFAEMRTVYIEGHKEAFDYVTPRDLAQKLAVHGTGTLLPIYTYTADAIRFVGPMDVATPETAVLVYYAKVPDFQVADASWLTEKYLDLYVYACLRHSASYLRDDERVMLWKNEYDETLASVDLSATRKKYAGSPLRMNLPGNVK